MHVRNETVIQDNTVTMSDAAARQHAPPPPSSTYNSYYYYHSNGDRSKIMSTKVKAVYSLWFDQDNCHRSAADEALSATNRMEEINCRPVTGDKSTTLSSFQQWFKVSGGDDDGTGYNNSSDDDSDDDDDDKSY